MQIVLDICNSICYTYTHDERRKATKLDDHYFIVINPMLLSQGENYE